MRSASKFLAAGTIFLMTASAAFPASAVEVKVSGLVFAHYEAVASKSLANGAPANDRNSFEISRAQLGAGAAVNPNWSGFVQLEANLISRENASNQVFLKQALLEYKEIYPGARVLFGLIPTPWRGFEEGLWKNRFVAKILEDEEGLLFATDRGLRLNGRIPRLEYDLMIANGEGTGPRTASGNESNKYKDYTGKVSLSPFADGTLSGFKLNAQIHRGMRMAGWPRDRWLAGPSFESSKFSCMAAYAASRDGSSVATGTGTVTGQGLTLHGVAGLTARSWAFARYDFWDPDTRRPDDGHHRLIAGLGYQPAEIVRLAVDYQAVIQQKRAATRADQGIISVHAEVKF